MPTITYPHEQIYPLVGSTPATDNAKYSLLHWQNVWQNQVPLPGGVAMSQGDKQQVLWGQSVVLWGGQGIPNLTMAPYQPGRRGNS